METEHMVHMANQIALFFAPYPKEEAITSVADHLRKFWVPAMRKQIIEYVAGGGAGLNDLAVEAVKRLH
jgi:formate dehydrogenase subunit delta